MCPACLCCPLFQQVALLVGQLALMKSAYRVPIKCSQSKVARQRTVSSDLRNTQFCVLCHHFLKHFCCRIVLDQAKLWTLHAFFFCALRSDRRESAERGAGRESALSGNRHCSVSVPFG